MKLIFLSLLCLFVSDSFAQAPLSNPGPLSSPGPPPSTFPSHDTPPRLLQGSPVEKGVADGGWLQVYAREQATPSNPFKSPKVLSFLSMGSGAMGMDEVMDEGGDEGGGYGSDMGMSMEMDWMGGMGMDMMEGTPGTGTDSRFRAGLRRAITALKRAKTASERETLLGYVREAFETRFQETIVTRRKELAHIKKRIAELESDLQRREAAKARVVAVQLQSVQLAAEGLLEFDAP